MNSNWSYGPDLPKLGQNLFWSLWPWLLTLTFCMDISSVSVNYSWWEVCVTKRWTGSFRAAWLQLKISILLQVIRRPLGNLPLHKIVVHSHSLGRVAIPDWSQANGDTHVSVKPSRFRNGKITIIVCRFIGDRCIWHGICSIIWKTGFTTVKPVLPP